MPSTIWLENRSVEIHLFLLKVEYGSAQGGVSFGDFKIFSEDTNFLTTPSCFYLVFQVFKGKPAISCMRSAIVLYGV